MGVYATVYPSDVYAIMTAACVLIADWLPRNEKGDALPWQNKNPNKS